MSTYNVAVIGAGPAGIYASDILSKSGLDVNIDLFERLPAPYGLVRYGVAPDHPRIKQIIVALYKILQRGDIRLLGNVEIGRDVTIDDLHAHYDAIIIATGADRDAPLNIPGVDLPQSYEIPENVAKGLAENPITDVHVFGRRGPAQVKFTPLELRELGHVPDVDIIVSEDDFDFDEGSEEALRASNQQRQVVKTLTNYAMEDPESHTASRRIHIHLFQSPVEILADENGNVSAIRTERTELTGDGSVRGTGVMTTWPVQAVYRAIGYYSSPVPGLPFDKRAGVVPNVEGRVIDSDTTKNEDAPVIPGIYATGWIKRGPVGLIGSTKSDAQQTISHLVEDAEAGRLHATSSEVGHEAMVALLRERGVEFTTWEGWELLDAYEAALGEQFGEVPGGRGTRERVKVVSRRAMTDISQGKDEVHEDLIGEMGEMGVPSAPERFEDYSGPTRA